MLNGTRPLLAAVALSTVFFAGCDAAGAPKSTAPKQAAREVLSAWYDGDWSILRFQRDAARARGWILTENGVVLFDFKTRRATAHIPLPGWQWVGAAYSCAPDFALGPQGEVLVSSNVLATLWRIDPVTLEVTRHEPVLDQDGDKDVGFSALAYSAEQGAYFGASALQGSLWRIDPSLKRAQKIPLSAPLRAACGIAVRPRVTQQKTYRLVGLCVTTAQAGWTINLAPDQRFGYVRAQSCPV